GRGPGAALGRRPPGLSSCPRTPPPSGSGPASSGPPDNSEGGFAPLPTALAAKPRPSPSGDGGAPASPRKRLALAHPRVEGVAEAVPEEVEAEDGQEDHQPRVGGQPRGPEDVLPSLAEHGPPLRRRGLDPQAQEAEPGGDEDR